MIIEWSNSYYYKKGNESKIENSGIQKLIILEDSTHGMEILIRTVEQRHNMNKKGIKTWQLLTINKNINLIN